MTSTSPKHDAVWARELVADLKSRGRDVEGLLAEVGLRESSLTGDGARISFAKHVALFERAADILGDDRLGLHFGQTRDTRDAGLLGYIGLSSATLSDAIANLSRYRRVFSDAMDVRIDDLETRGLLTWEFRDGAANVARQSIEFTAANWVRGFRETTGIHLVPVSLAFAHDRTEGIDEFERFFGCPVRFGHRANSLELRPDDLGRQLLTADNRLLGLLRQYCQEVLARRSKQSPPLIERVERAVADRLTNGRATLATVAADLGMSSRTLSRRLADLETSFYAVLADLRNQLAHRYLHESRLSCTEIAFVLGYSDVSSFNHAFKRWTGLTPTAARRSMPR